MNSCFQRAIFDIWVISVCVDALRRDLLLVFECACAICGIFEIVSDIWLQTPTYIHWCLITNTYVNTLISDYRHQHTYIDVLLQTPTYMHWHFITYTYQHAQISEHSMKPINGCRTVMNTQFRVPVKLTTESCN